MRSLWYVALVAVVAGPQSTAPVVRFGPTASQVTDGDLAALKALPEMPARDPWAMRASEGWGGWGAEFFFRPDHVTDELRRGAMLVAVARRRPDASAAEVRTWEFSYLDRWAQVPTQGSNPDVLTGPRDLNRPFRIRAELSDADLTAIIRLIRSSPTVPVIRTWPPDPAPPPATVHGDWPVLFVRDSRERNGITVSTIGLSPRENTGQAITLERSAAGWTITFVGIWTSD